MKNPKIKQCIKDVLNYEMIFLLEQAEYFIIGDTPKTEWLHYALNMPVYTHFTSPIRRYPDIMVHRQLISVIDARRNNLPMEQISVPTYKRLKEIVDRCNKNKVSAKKVSSGCEKVPLILIIDLPMSVPEDASSLLQSRPHRPQPILPEHLRPKLRLPQRNPP